jgi:hypothetical protein
VPPVLRCSYVTSTDSRGRGTGLLRGRNLTEAQLETKITAAQACYETWRRNISITTRLVDTVSTPMLLKVVRAHKIDPKRRVYGVRRQNAPFVKWT